MSVVYVTSDWHIGHKGISERFRTQFPSDAYHDDYILGNVLGTVTKRDILYVIGDATWTEAGLARIADAQIPAKMILVGGNHDTMPVHRYREVFDDIVGVKRYKDLWLTHIPIHPMELYRGVNVHGHCHRGGPYEAEQDTRYFNAILEFNDYMPVSVQNVRRIMRERQQEKDND